MEKKTHRNFRSEEVVAEGAGSAVQLEGLAHVKRMEDGRRQLDVPKVARAVKRRESAGSAPVPSFVSSAPPHARSEPTYTSPLPRGPYAASYMPPALAWLRLSKRTGFVTCLTEMRLMSSDWRWEKEMDVIVEEMG